jgi:hypothetical protein
MKAAIITFKRLIIWPITKTMAFVNEHPKIKSRCLYHMGRFPLLSERLLRIHRNYNTITEIESNINEIRSFFASSGSSLPDIDASSIPPRALLIYEDLKNAIAERSGNKN